MRARTGLLVGLHIGFGLLVTCSSVRASVKPHRTGTARHSLQGPSLQGTALPVASPEWLRGPGLVATLADGRVVDIVHFAGDAIHANLADETGGTRTVILSPHDLVGMHWKEMRCANDSDGICTEMAFRITAAVRDDSSSLQQETEEPGDIWLYAVDYVATDGEPADWTPACGRGSSPDDSSEMGLFVDGSWDGDGSWRSDGYTFSCPRGVIAKCARAWGYRPWQTRESPEHGPVDLQPLHLACTRAARAEYCGDGVSYTEEGVLIDLFDIYGFNRREPVAGFTEESTWDELGAITVHHARVPGLYPTQCPTPARTQKTSRETSRTTLIHVWSAPLPEASTVHFRDDD